MSFSVYVVEDEMIVSLDIQNRLKRLGYQVVGSSSSGEEALHRIGAIMPDVVLMDVSLQSSMDGVEVAAKIREQMSIPVVFLTAFSDRELIDRMQVTQPFAYILKPFEEVELHAALQIASMRHNLEHLLVEQKQLLTATLDTIEDGVIVTGEDGAVRFMNPVAERLTGWTLGEASCRPLHEVYRLTDEGTLTARDGTSRRIESRSQLMKDDAGVWLGFVHSFIDVTDRELSRRSLHERDVEYRILMEQAVDAIFLADGDGRLLAVNAKACELVGFDREELLGMTAQDLFDQEELRANPMQLPALRAGRSLTVERKVHRKDGTVLQAEIHAKALSDGRLQAILRDITGRKRDEKEFKEAVRSEVVDRLLHKLRVFAHGESAAMNLNRLALFCDNPDALFTVPAGPNPGGPLERFRSAGEEFLGVIAPELLIVSSLAAIIESDPVFGPVALRLAGSAARLRDAIMPLQVDLQPLLADLLVRPAKPPDKQLFTRLRILGNAVGEIRTILHDLSVALQAELTCDLSEVLKTTLARFSADSSPIVLKYENGVENVRVVMKGADLSEVVSTLIQNAIDALSSVDGAEEKWVSVRGRPVNGKVLIEVEDNGPGVDEEHREMIFDDSFSTKGPSRGFGLGSALRCLQGCGGALRLDTGVARGARFVVALVRAV